MKKRGSMALVLIIEILIGVTTFAGLVGLGAQAGQGELLLKNNIAKDIGLIIGMLESSTVETHVQYPRDLTRYSLRITHNCVIVSLGFDDNHPARYCFPYSKKVKQVHLQGPREVYVLKTSEGIILTDKGVAKTKIDFCSDIDDVSINSIYIDPIFTGKFDSDVLAIAQSIHSSISGVGRLEISTPNRRSIEKRDDHEQQMKRADLIIHVTALDESAKSVRASSSKELQTLACHSIRKIQGAEHLTTDVLGEDNIITYIVSSTVFSESENLALSHSIGSSIGVGLSHALS